jgi:hypothetical protein
MKSYLWPGADAVIQRRLRQEGVPFFLWKDGIVFDQESDMQRALAVFCIGAIDLKSEFENLQQLVLLFPSALAHEDAAHAKQIQMARTKARYVSVCISRASALREAARTTFWNSTEGLKPFRSQFVKAVRQNLLIELHKQGTALIDYLSAQHAELCAAGGVRFVQCSPDKVIVFTETVHCKSVNGDRIELGNFVLAIDFSCTNAGLRFTNLSRVVNGFEEGMHAPNVFAHGRPYLDEIEQVWLELIGRFEFSLVVDLALQFLQNSGKTAWLGEYADKWPATAE